MTDLAFSAQNLTKRIFLIKDGYFIFKEKLLNVSSLSDYRIVRQLARWTIMVSDYRSDPLVTMLGDTSLISLCWITANGTTILFITGVFTENQQNGIR